MIDSHMRITIIAKRSHCYIYSTAKIVVEFDLFCSPCLGSRYYYYYIRIPSMQCGSLFFQCLFTFSADPSLRHFTRIYRCVVSHIHTIRTSSRKAQQWRPLFASPSGSYVAPWEKSCVCHARLVVLVKTFYVM